MSQVLISKDWLVWEEVRSRRSKQAGHKSLSGIFSSAVFLISLGLGLFGVLMVGSASVSLAEKNFASELYYLKRQATFLGLGVFFALLVIKIPVVFWERVGPSIFLLAIALLVAVLFVGETVNNSTRWIRLGGINIQPSEFAKLAVIIYLAGYLVRHKNTVSERFSAFLRPVLLISAVGTLVLIEPDLGGMLILLMVTLIMMYLGGVNFFQFFFFILALVVIVVLALYLGPEYRLERILSMYDDIWSDPYGRNYQITQSLIAFGNGKLTGLGFGLGVQKLFYLPEAHTDFIFAVIAEELGALGAILLLLIFAILIWKIFAIGRRAIDCGQDFSAFYAYGFGVLLAVQVFVNTGVNTRLLPATGMTLPFISYGGSSLIVLIVGVAILLRIEHELCPRILSKTRRAT